MYRKLWIALLIASLAPFPRAQDVREEKRKEIEAQIQKMRQQLREGRLLRSHVRLTVRLKNGNKLQGVVKDGRLIEKVDGLHFVAAEAKSPGAGIRVWYFDETDSYVFLPFEDIAHYKVRERLTTEQLKEIERRIAESQRRQEELRRLEAEKRKQAATTGTEPPGGEPGKGGGDPSQKGEPDAKKKEGELSEEDKRLQALLEEFPPSEGWSAAKRREIEMRKVTVGAYPDARSRRFLEVYADWQRAVDKFGDQEPDGPAPPPPPPEKKGR